MLAQADAASHPRPMKVVIANADPELSASIGFSLRQAGHEIEIARQPEEVLLLLRRDTVDFLLLDMNLAEPGAIELCRSIRRLSNVPIMMLTARDSEDDLVSAIEAGADEYLRKPLSPRALVARVRALARRARPLDKVLQAGELQLDLEQHVLRIGSTQIVLSPLELKALQLLLATPGRTVPSEKLLLHLWGRDSDRERHILKQLIYRLRGKLEAHGAPNVLHTTPGSGYKLSL
jgi:DNA-binding response OmpR family regulator